jgi:hypothetical protein
VILTAVLTLAYGILTTADAIPPLGDLVRPVSLSAVIIEHGNDVLI